MNRIAKMLALGSALLGIGIATADNGPRQFLGPTAHVGFTNNFNDTAAYNVLGEYGKDNARVGATMGFNVYDNQYFKVSGEYLWQRLKYSFFTRQTRSTEQCMIKSKVNS